MNEPSPCLSSPLLRAALASLLLVIASGTARSADTTLRGTLIGCAADLPGATVCLEQDARRGQVVVLPESIHLEQPMYILRDLDSLMAMRLPVTVRGTLVGRAFDPTQAIIVASQGGETRIEPIPVEAPDAAVPPSQQRPPTVLGSLRELISAAKVNPARAIGLYGQDTPGFRLLAAVESVEVQRRDDGQQVAVVKLGNELVRIGGSEIVNPDPTSTFYCVAPLQAAGMLEPKRMTWVEGTLHGVEKRQRYDPLWRMNQDHFEIVAICRFEPRN